MLISELIINVDLELYSHYAHRKGGGGKWKVLDAQDVGEERRGQKDSRHQSPSKCHVLQPRSDGMPIIETLEGD